MDLKKIGLVLLLAVMTFVAFLPALEGGFVNWDDGQNVVLNHRIKHLSWSSIGDLFFNVRSGHYHNPLVYLTYAIEYHFVGLNAWVYHFNNIVLHVINSLLVLWLINLMTKQWTVALVVAVLFAVHPQRVESVTWITERKDVLFALFYLAGLISYIYHYKISQRDSLMSSWKKKRTFILTLLFMILSCLSKPTAFTFPLALILMDVYLKRPLNSKAWIQKWPFFGLAIIFSFISFVGLRDVLVSVNSNTVFSLIDRVLLAFHALNLSLMKMVWPTQLSIVYPFPEKLGGSLPLIVWISPIILAGVVGILYKMTDNKRLFVYGIGMFLLLMILPIVNMGGGFFINDRYMYLPCIGLFLLLISVGQDWLAQKKLNLNIKRIMVFCLCLYVSFYVKETYAHNKVWLNGNTLFSHVIERYPNYAGAYTHRGHYWLKQKDYEAAQLDLNKSLQLNPKDPKPYVYMGEMHFSKGENQQAIEFFDKAIALKPAFGSVYTHRGNAWFDYGDMSKANVDFAKALEIDPYDHIATYGRGMVFRKQGDYRMALGHFNQVIKLYPDAQKAYLRRGELFLLFKEYAHAQHDVAHYLEDQPNDANANLVMGTIYSEQQKFAQALPYFNQAIALDANNGQAYYLRAKAHVALGNMKEVMEDFDIAKSLGVEFVN